MPYDPERHHRRSIRLKDYDYRAEGAYFVTLCVQDRVCLFGEIGQDAMHLNAIRQAVEECWHWLPQRYPYVVRDEWVVMPNHLHGILVITEDDPIPQHGTGNSKPAIKRKTLGRLIGAFKTVSTKQVNVLRGTPAARLWQRDFYDRVIRNERELNTIRDYIYFNPANWRSDTEYW